MWKKKYQMFVWPEENCIIVELYEFIFPFNQDKEIYYRNTINGALTI